MTARRKIKDADVKKISDIILNQGFTTINGLANATALTYTTIKKLLFDRLKLRIKGYIDWKRLGLIPIIIKFRHPRQLLTGDYVLGTFISNFPIGAYFQYMLLPPEVILDLKRALHLVDAQDTTMYDISLINYEVNLHNDFNLNLRTFKYTPLDEWNVHQITQKHLEILRELHKNYLIQNKIISRLIKLSTITTSKYKQELIKNKILIPLFVFSEEQKEWYISIFSKRNNEKSYSFQDKYVFELSNLQTGEKEYLTVFGAKYVSPRKIIEIYYEKKKQEEDLYLFMNINKLRFPDIKLYDEKNKKWIWNYESIGLSDII